MLILANKGGKNMSEILLSEYREILTNNVEGDKLGAFFTYLDKVERIVELTTEFREIISDIDSSNTEEEYALQKLDEAFEEYEFFLDNLSSRH